MGPMRYARVDGKILTPESIVMNYSGGYDRQGARALLEALRVARSWGLTLEEYNEWMDQPTDDLAHMYYHNIFCTCRNAYHFDNMLWSMGAMGSAHYDREQSRGTDWPDHQKVSRARGF